MKASRRCTLCGLTIICFSGILLPFTEKGTCMSMMKKVMCVMLALMMAACLFGCGEDNKKNEEPADVSAYLGTWQGSDHDEKNVVHYLIFDNDGYWKVSMNYTPLVRAIKQLPDQLVSFKIFCQLQNSGQTKCFYEYIKNDDITYDDYYTIGEDGKMTEKDIDDVYYTKISTHTGEPDSTIAAQAQDLFDRAREEALK